MSDKLVICLASTLNLDGTPSSTAFDAVSATPDSWQTARVRVGGQRGVGAREGGSYFTWLLLRSCQPSLSLSACGSCAAATSGELSSASLPRALSLPVLFAHSTCLRLALPQSFASGRRTLMDSFDYVMHGKVFKFNDNSASGQLKADVSGRECGARLVSGSSGAGRGGAVTAQPAGSLIRVNSGAQEMCQGLGQGEAVH